VIGLAILAASLDKYAPDAVQTAASAFSSLEAGRLPDDRVVPLARSASPWSGTRRPRLRTPRVRSVSFTRAHIRRAVEQPKGRNAVSKA